MTDFNNDLQFYAGWATADITPDQTVAVAGQMHTRVSEGIMDPISANVLVCESRSGDELHNRSIMLSCDLVCISDELRSAVINALGHRPDINGDQILMNATHTHSAPDTRSRILSDESLDAQALGIQDPKDYIHFIAPRIAEAIIKGCDDCQASGVSSGVSQATIAYNRRLCYTDGTTQMYGGYNRKDFSHVESGSDTSVNVMCVWNKAQQLTGLVVNLACPSQLSEHIYQISADFWCETRTLLRQEYGEDIIIVSQVSAAGDLSPMRESVVPDWEAQKRTWDARGQTIRDVVAERLHAAVNDVVNQTQARINWSPMHNVDMQQIDLAMRMVTAEEAEDARASAKTLAAECKQLEQSVDKHKTRWYIEPTRTACFLNRARGVVSRFENQYDGQCFSTTIHAMRIGDAVFISNQFELFLDYGLQIKGRSPATHTFIVQLAGPGTYLPTQRAVAGGGYGAMPASTPVGPIGGAQLVDKSLALIERVWQEQEDHVPAVIN